MHTPSGEQFEISGGGYRAVVTECGAGLRILSHDGQGLVAGYSDDQMASGGKGQQLIPWPNRVRDGAYTFGGRAHQLPITEPTLGNATHGLVRWVAWTPEEHTASSVSLVYRLMAQSGYPWTLDLNLRYDLSADGLTVTLNATNLSDSMAPFAYGAHPYLTTGAARVTDDELLLPAGTRMINDDRMVPVSREDVDGTAYDFRVSRPIRELPLDHAFTFLTRDEDGRAVTRLTDPGGPGKTNGRPDGRHSVELWVDGSFEWLQVYTGDKLDPPRTAVAIEPMTAPPDALRTGEDLMAIESGGQVAMSWGIRAVS